VGGRGHRRFRYEAFAGIDCGWWREAIERVRASGKGETSLPRMRLSPGLDARRPPATNVEFPQREIDSLAILPMIARGRTVGVLSLGLGASRLLRCAPAVDRADLGRGAIAITALLYKMRQDRRKNEFWRCSRTAQKPAGAIAIPFMCWAPGMRADRMGRDVLDHESSSCAAWGCARDVYGSSERSGR
jgi:hypothetical protein